MTRILGIDPGSHITGFGLIDVTGAKMVHVASGCVRTDPGELPGRLRQIFEGIRAVVAEYGPAEVAVERAFVAHNADSALKLGHARGAAICATLEDRLPVFEYSPREVKKAIVGSGAAAKEQVQHMIRALLSIQEALAADAADALGVAVCHAHVRTMQARLGPGNSFRRRRR